MSTASIRPTVNPPAARAATLPPPPSFPSTIPPTPKGHHRLQRRFKLPDGHAVTLTMAEVPALEGGAAPVVSYRLTHHEPGQRHGRVIFEGQAAREPDPEDSAYRILRLLTTTPGEQGDERMAEYTPAQLDWSVHFAEVLRAAVDARLGWADAGPQAIRADIEVIAATRAELRAGSRYRARLGVVEVSARTKREVRTALAAAVGAHCSATPAVRVGEATRDVYLLYPLGREWVVQLIHPNRPLRPAGVAQRFEASGLDAAVDILDATVRHREAGLGAALEPAVPTRPARRPAARARIVAGVAHA